MLNSHPPKVVLPRGDTPGKSTASPFAGILNLLINLNQMLQIRWRRWLTRQYLGAWLADRAYYQLQLGHATDNSDQRIAENVNQFTVYVLSLSVGLLTSILSLVSFLVILWGLSGPVQIPLGTWGTLHMPAYLVWAALLYSAADTWLTLKMGRPPIEHVGLTGSTVKSSTRSIVSEGRLLAFTLLHGVHRQRAGLRHVELPQHASSLVPTPEQQRPYPSCRCALLDLLRRLADPRVGAQWRIATPSRTRNQRRYTPRLSPRREICSKR